MNRTAHPSATERLARPFPNSYWVEPGRLLAGEYPGSTSRTEAIGRIEALLRAGVNSFVDLTEEGELPPYDVFLPKDGPMPVEHRRLPITDHGLPRSPQAMTDILDAIHAQLAAGRCVYVHCHAGIGRTGMAVGCYLVRGGLANENALDRLQMLWQECARSRSWPSIPETQEQVEFVRSWCEPSSQNAGGVVGFAERCEGALIGLAIGEAAGLLLVQGSLDASSLAGPLLPDGMVFETGADTAMTLAVAESLLACGGHNAEDQMQRYLQFARTGEFTQTGVAAANVSPEFKRALAAWQWSRKANVGTHDPKNLDPHTLSRCLAVVLYSTADAAAAMELAANVSRTTQQSPVVLDACRLWTACLIDALTGSTKAELLDMKQGAAVQALRQRTLRKELNGLLDRQWRALAAGNGSVLSVMARALMAMDDAMDFKSGMLHVLSPPVSVTAGALYGALAGAHYGSRGIPQSWQRALPQLPTLRAVAQRSGR